MADEKKQMSEENLDKVSGGMQKQYVLNQEEYEEYEGLKDRIGILESAIHARHTNPDAFGIVAADVDEDMKKRLNN